MTDPFSPDNRRAMAQYFQNTEDMDQREADGFVEDVAVSMGRSIHENLNTLDKQLGFVPREPIENLPDQDRQLLHEIGEQEELNKSAGVPGADAKDAMSFDKSVLEGQDKVEEERYFNSMFDGPVEVPEDPENFIPEPKNFQGEIGPVTLYDLAKSAAVDVSKGMIDAPLQVIGGIQDAANAVLEIPEVIVDYFMENGNSIDFNENTKRPDQLLQVPLHIPKPSSKTGMMVRDMSRFTIGFFGVGKFKTLGTIMKSVGMTAPIAKAAVQGMIADFLVSEEGEQNTFNLMEDLGVSKEYTEWLSVAPHEDDAGFMKTLGDKMKNVVDGAILGTAMDLTSKFAKVVKAKIWKRKIEKAIASKTTAGTPLKLTPEEKQGNEDFLRYMEEKQTVEQRNDLYGLVGNPDNPKFTFGKPLNVSVDQILNPTAKEVPKHTADQVFINWSRINGDDDIDSLIQELADSGKVGIDEQRRGVVTHAQTIAAAEKENAWKMLRDDAPQLLNDSQTLALRELWYNSAQHVQDIARLVNKSPTEVNKYALNRAVAIHELIQRKAIGVRTEQARALRQWAIPVGQNAEFQAQFEQIAKIMDNTPGRTEELTKNILAFAESGNLPAMDRYIKDQRVAATKGALRQLFYFSLLSGTKTWARNTVGNTGKLLFNTVERKVAAGIGKTIGYEQYVADEEAAALMMGALQSMKSSFNLRGAMNKLVGKASTSEDWGGFWQSLKTGKSGYGIGKVSEDSVGGSISEFGEAMEFGKIGQAVANSIDKLTSVPARVLVASDEFAGAANYFGELSAQAWRKAYSEVKKGKITQEQMADRMAEIVKDPGEYLKIASMKHAKESTYTNRPERTQVYALWDAMSKFPVFGKLMVPFKDAAYNIGVDTLERTPLAPISQKWRNDINAGGARADLAMAKMTVGISMLTIGADLALRGVTTGDFSSMNNAQRNELRRSGVQPMTIQIGDYRMSYNAMEPFSAPLGIASNLVEYLRTTNDSQATQENIVFASVFAVMAQLTNANYMDGFNAITQAADEPMRYGGKSVRSMARPLVPSMLNDIEAAVDPEVSYTNSLLGMLAARTPGLSRLVPKNYDLYGREKTVRSPMGGVFDFFSPSRVSKVKEEPIDKWMRLNRAFIDNPETMMSFPSSSGNMVEINMQKYPGAYQEIKRRAGSLTEDEYGSPINVKGSDGKFFMSTGRPMLEELNDLVQGTHPIVGGSFDRLSKGKHGGQHDLIQNIFNKYRNQAKKSFLRDNPAFQEIVDKREFDINEQQRDLEEQNF